jgi:hypothetical protein
MCSDPKEYYAEEMSVRYVSSKRRKFVLLPLSGRVTEAVFKEKRAVFK